MIGPFFAGLIASLIAPRSLIGTIIVLILAIGLIVFVALINARIDAMIRLIWPF